MSVRIAHLDELPVVGEGPPVWHAVRQVLGIGAFGINAFSAASAGDLVIEDHDEVSSAAAGHEELYVVVRGRARFAVDGEEIDAPAGTLVFVPDAASRRVAHAAEDDTAVLVVGGLAGEAFSPSAWEQSAFAAHLAQRGERDRALAMAREVVERHPDKGSALFNVACVESLAGEREAALEHLRRAVELDPRAAEWAASDADLDAIRDDPAFPRSVAR